MQSVSEILNDTEKLPCVECPELVEGLSTRCACSWQANMQSESELLSDTEKLPCVECPELVEGLS
jgi:hypothetical protein